MKTDFCDQETIHQGIEQTFDMIMLELYWKNHVHANPRPLQPSPTLSERLEWAYYDAIAERISDV